MVKPRGPLRLAFPHPQWRRGRLNWRPCEQGHREPTDSDYTSACACPLPANFCHLPFMDFFLVALITATGAYMLKSAEQRKRIALLGSHLSQYQIEKLMESLSSGYLRALGESDASRRDQIWQLQESTETQLCDQFNRFVTTFAKVDAADTRVSKIALAFPFADRLFPAATFDLRKAFAIHAKGFTQTTQNAMGRSPRDKAFTMSAELFLMQHTCHWFCKSKTIASARLMARHQSTYEQVLASVSPATREAYRALVGA